MLHASKLDYDKEILEILTRKDGCVTGFNILMNMKGKYYFHPKLLKMHLEKLAGEKKITIEKTKNRIKYCLMDFDFEKEFEKYASDLEKLDIKSFKPNINRSEKISLAKDFLRLALKKYYQLNIYWLYAECSGDSTQVKIIDLAKKKILNSMRNKLSKLKESDRNIIINTFLSL